MSFNIYVEREDIGGHIEVIDRNDIVFDYDLTHGMIISDTVNMAIVSGGRLWMCCSRNCRRMRSACTF